MKVVSLLFHDVVAGDLRESGFASEAADRYKLSIPSFEGQLQELKRAGIGVPILAGDIARFGDASGSPIPTLLTFDDGGESYYTVAADRLEARGWRGHCFVSTAFIGRRGFLSSTQIRELDARGHVIGSHTVSHPARFSALSFAHMRREWSDSRRALEDLLGHAVTVGSVPGGYFSRHVAAAAWEAGLRVLFTSEPTRATSRLDTCTVVGRFTIRRGHPLDMAQRFVTSPWARWGAWVSWNAKAVVKPVFGPSYARVADWLLATRTSTHHG